MWMADVQTNPYGTPLSLYLTPYTLHPTGNLKLRPSTEPNAPTMFSSDPNVRVSSLSTLSGFSRNPRPETRNPKHETRDPKTETRIPNPEIRNPRSETQHPKPETRHP